MSLQTELARTDSLTGLLNRRAFEEATGSELARAARHRYALTVVYIDVDHFKTINDEFGHAVGDSLLQDIGSSIRKAIRRVDVAARLGGDEFAILLSETGDTVSDDAVLRMRRVVLDELQARRWSISLSMGAVTAAPGHGDVSIDRNTGRCTVALTHRRAQNPDRIVLHGHVLPPEDRGLVSSHGPAGITYHLPTQGGGRLGSAVRAVSGNTVYRFECGRIT